MQRPNNLWKHRDVNKINRREKTGILALTNSHIVYCYVGHCTVIYIY